MNVGWLSVETEARILRWLHEAALDINLGSSGTIGAHFAFTLLAVPVISTLSILS